jgi:hypothetical protein
MLSDHSVGDIDAVLFFFFLVVLGLEIELARQVLYYLSHAPSPFLCFPDFSNKFSCFWLTGQDYNFLTYASRVGIMTCMYHHIYFDWDGVLLTFCLASLALNQAPPDLCFPSSQNYRHEPPSRSSFSIFSIPSWLNHGCRTLRHRYVYVWWPSWAFMAEVVWPLPTGLQSLEYVLSRSFPALDIIHLPSKDIFEVKGGCQQWDQDLRIVTWGCPRKDKACSCSQLIPWPTQVLVHSVTFQV